MTGARADFDFDAVVVAAGGVGLACGYALARRGLSVVVIGKERAIGQGISSRNSQMRTGALLSHGLAEGSVTRGGRAPTLRVPWEPRGRSCPVRQAGGGHEGGRNRAAGAIEAQAIAHGVEDIASLSAAQVHAGEPELKAVMALISPQSGVFDGDGYMLALPKPLASGAPRPVGGLRARWRLMEMSLKGNRMVSGWRSKALVLGLVALTLTWAGSAFAATARWSVLSGGEVVGHVSAETERGKVAIVFDVKNNGRGPTVAETLTIGADGLPTAWDLTGATTFGSKVSEHYRRQGGMAEWTDSTGHGSAKVEGPALYVAQSGSPWALGLYARALLHTPGHRLEALPGGVLTLEKGETFTVSGVDGPIPVTRYALAGNDLTPETVLLDANGDLFAAFDPGRLTVREGYEGEQARLRKLAATWATQRLADIEREAAHRYAGPVRISNVRLFDPKTSALTGAVSVLVRGKTIAAVEPLDSPATQGETTIDGGGGTLVAGFYEMHAHLQQDQALLNLLAGITTVRDMGNDNAALDRLTDQIDAGVLGGPHVIRSGFIEGRSPYSEINGILVDNQDEAIDAVRWYGARGYWQIKIYNSINPAWVPAMVREAHGLGMRVAGHIPAFATADQMIEAGYDEITHINQFSLGWVIGPAEDTRTLFRLTALKRLPGLDLNSPKVRRTVDLMVEGHKAIDPTLGIHEQLTENRDGVIPPGAVDYFDHMPIGWRRNAMKAWLDTSAPGDDEAYRQGFEKLLDVVRILHDRGVFIVFGTDTGGAFTYHRELELYQRAGFTPPEILKRATLDTARYVGQDQTMGSIEKGKLADFFLIPGDPTRTLKAIKTIRMVVKDGVFYFPSEVYPKFGIRPFTTAPAVAAESETARGLAQAVNTRLSPDAF